MLKCCIGEEYVWDMYFVFPLCFVICGLMELITSQQCPSLVLSSWGWPWLYNALPQERKVIISKRYVGAVITS
jgi:hypothetical protein